MKILGKIPDKVYLACSGGVDSMVALDFLLKGKREVTLLYFNHNTDHGNKAESFLHSFCIKNNLGLHIRSYQGDLNTEEAWREARYKFLEFHSTRPILTVHHLNDNIETYLLSTIKGTPKFIPYSRKNVIRPFLLTSKQEIIDYAIRNNLEWIEDPSNSESNYSRNKIRNEVIPVLKSINEGLEKTFRNKCIEKYKRDGVL